MKDLFELQREMEQYGVGCFYDNSYKKYSELEGWKSLAFHNATKGGKEGCVVYIANAKPYIEIKVNGEHLYSNPTYILIGTNVWYPKNQRYATEEEENKAISFIEKKIEERKATIERARNNPSIEIIRNKIYNKFLEINTNDKINITRNLQFFHEDNGLIGYMVVEKNSFNEATIKMVYPKIGETFPVNYFENGLTDHYYHREKSWKDFFEYCL